MERSDTNPDPDLAFFEALVEENQAAVRSFIVSHIDDPFEAYDLAQETFLVAFRLICNIDTDRPIRPWLFGIAMNQVRNHQRKHRAIPAGHSEEIGDLLQSLIDSHPDQDGEMFDALEICMNKLDDERRRLLKLRYEEGLNIAEIRESIGGKHSALTMKLHRIREQLRLCIKSQTSQL